MAKHIVSKPLISDLKKRLNELIVLRSSENTDKYDTEIKRLSDTINHYEYGFKIEI